MGISRVLWHVPERLIHMHVRLFSALTERTKSYPAKRVCYSLLYAPYICNYLLVFKKLRHTTAAVYRKKTRLPVIHVSGPSFGREKDDIFLGDMMKGVKRDFRFSVIGRRPAISLLDAPAVGLRAGSIERVSRSISSFTVSILPREVSGKTSVAVSIKSGTERRIVFRIGSVREATGIKKAAISRLKSGARFALCWRLDWDHATSPGKLKEFFRLVEKWGIPPTIYVSGAVLDEKLYGDFLEKSGGTYVLGDMRDRTFGYRTPPGMAEMRQSKKLLPKLRFSGGTEFPIGRFTAEIGNHMFRHFGGPESGWQEVPGDMASIESDLLKNHALIRKAFRTEPRAWSRPSSRRYPPAFIGVLKRHGYDSVSNFRHRMGPLNSPCLGTKDFQGVTEVLSNYPRDPYFVSDVKALESALGCCNASRGTASHMMLCSHLGPPFVLCTTDALESLFASALESQSWPCTVSAFVGYSGNAGKIRLRVTDGRIIADNPTGVELKSVPVEIFYGSGYADMITIDCPAHRAIELKI